MLRALITTHPNHNIHQTSRLGRGPMNARRLTSRGDIGQINDKIPDLSPKHIRRSKPQYTIRIPRFILIAINYSQTREALCCFEDREVIGVADELGVVVV